MKPPVGPARPLAVLMVLAALLGCSGAAAVSAFSKPTSPPRRGSRETSHSRRAARSAACRSSRSQRGSCKTTKPSRRAAKAPKKAAPKSKPKTPKQTGGSSIQPAASPANPDQQPPAGQSLYWGAWIGSQLTGAEAPWDYEAVDRFQQDTGSGLSLVSFSSPFMNCSTAPCQPYAFPSTPFSTIRANGAIPFFSWSSASLPVSAIEPQYTLREVIAGRYDSYIATWATAAREWGHPFFLRFDWEMNASSFPWSTQTNGNDAAEYVEAWQHVHDIFTAVGARNATWVWCPNADPSQSPLSLASLYPGNAYVDWTCLDGYNSDNPWRSFGEIFTPDYEAITQRIAPGKPMLIGETASTAIGGSKASWISQMFTSLAAMPSIKGLIWFDRTTGGDWPVETTSSTLAAFRAGITGGPFVGNVLGGLERSPIPAP